MTVRRAPVVGLAVALLALQSTTSTFAQSSAGLPPPPPPPPVCKICAGPPPPPTPVPTVAPTLVAAREVVDVRLVTPRVARGHPAKLHVAASTDDAVTVTVRYRNGATNVYHARIGDSGALVKSWKVPTSAAVGKGTVTVTVEGNAQTFAKKLTLVVIR